MKSLTKYNRISLFVAPIILALLYVVFFGVNTMLSDEWDLVSFFMKSDSHQLVFNDFFEQHNEHRLVFPKMIFLLIYKISAYNSVYGMLVTLLLITATSAIYLKESKSLYRFSYLEIPYWLILANFIVFSFSQYQNLLWGFQLSFVMPLTFSICSFYTINTASKNSNYSLLIVALLAAIVSSFSSSMGLLTWPIGIVTILLSKQSIRYKTTFGSIWILTGILCWIAYFASYSKPENHPSVLIIVQKPVLFFAYFLSACGNLLPSFFHSKHLNAAIGIGIATGLTTLFINITSIFVLFKQKKLAENAFWITLSLFSLAVVAIITIGRSGFGIEQAFTSRYCTYTIPLYVATIAMASTTFNQIPASIQSGIKTGFILLIGALLYMGVKRGVYNKDENESFRNIVLNYKNASDTELKRIYPAPGVVRKNAPILEQKHLSSFNTSTTNK